MSVSEPLVGAVLAAAFAVVAYFVRKVLRDINGVSRKITKVLGLLGCWDDLDEKEHRAQVRAILEGK